MSKPTVATTLLSLFAILASSPEVSAQAKDQDKQKPVVCAVIKIDEKFQVVTKEELAGLKAKLDKEHKEAVADHKKRKAEAVKNKEKFAEPAPKKVKFKVVKNGLAQDKADALAKQMAEAAAKKRSGGKDAKKDAKDAKTQKAKTRKTKVKKEKAKKEKKEKGGGL